MKKKIKKLFNKIKNYSFKDHSIRFLIDLLNYPNRLSSEIERKAYWNIPLTFWDKIRLRIAIQLSKK